MTRLFHPRESKATLIVFSAALLLMQGTNTESRTRIASQSTANRTPSGPSSSSRSIPTGRLGRTDVAAIQRDNQCWGKIELRAFSEPDTDLGTVHAFDDLLGH